MLYNLLSSAIDKERAVPIDEAALYALLGFAIVFLGIAFLIFVVWLVGKILSKPTRSATPKKTEVVPQPDAKTAEGEDEPSDEVVAVIMAALTAYYRENNPKCEFTVKRIKRI